MSKYTIRMNFKKALQKAQDLEDISNDLKQLGKQRFNNTIHELSINWTGENAQKFIGKGGKLQEQLEDTSRELQKTAETIRRIAQEVYLAEMEALRIAQERNL